jgi:hypothetical protein
MSKYILVARMDDTSNGAWINAQTDDDARMKSIEFILDKAMDNDLWAKGRIELRDIEGRLVAEMEAKPAPVVDLPVFSKMFHKMSGL